MVLIRSTAWEGDDTFNDDTPAQTFGEVEGDEPMRLIGIAGCARSGKNTTASFLMDVLSAKWDAVAFADPIKHMLHVIGIECTDHMKAEIVEGMDVTPRYLMQTLGTEWGRAIDPDIWVKTFKRLNAGMCLVVPDVRFENEADLVRKHGILIHVTGRGGIEGNHVSEKPLSFKPGDIVMDNSRDMDWLRAQVDGNAVIKQMNEEAAR